MEWFWFNTFFFFRLPRFFNVTTYTLDTSCFIITKSLLWHFYVYLEHNIWIAVKKKYYTNTRISEANAHELLPFIIIILLEICLWDFSNTTNKENIYIYTYFHIYIHKWNSRCSSVRTFISAFCWWMNGRPGWIGLNVIKLSFDAKANVTRSKGKQQQKKNHKMGKCIKNEARQGQDGEYKYFRNIMCAAFIPFHSLHISHAFAFLWLLLLLLLRCQ